MNIASWIRTCLIIVVICWLQPCTTLARCVLSAIEFCVMCHALYFSVPGS
jgi:hypothetical protein